MKFLFTCISALLLTITSLKGQVRLDVHHSELKIKEALSAHKDGIDDLALFIIFRKDTALTLKGINGKIHEKYATLKHDLSSLKRKYWKDLTQFTLIYHELEKGNQYAPLAIYELDSSFVDVLVHFRPHYDRVINKTEEIRKITDPEKSLHKSDFYAHFAHKTKRLQWNGTINNCEPGNLSMDNYSTIVDQWKYLRRLARVTDKIDLDDTYNAYAQKAALIMAANDTITANVEDNWKCYSDEGRNRCQTFHL